MVQISFDNNQSFYSKQVNAISTYFETEKLKNKDLDFETAFSMWLTNGYGEKFRHLYLVKNQQYN